MAAPVYLVDSDVFITAKNLYYSFDICPGVEWAGWMSSLSVARIGHHHLSSSPPSDRRRVATSL